MSIREPTADGNGVLWVKDVRCWRVVDDDGTFQVSPDLRKIFDIVTLMVVATLAEKPMMDDVVDIQLIQQGVTVLLSCQHSEAMGTRVWRADFTLETDAVKTTTS